MKTFAELSQIDVSEHTEKKGQFTYLSWSWAHNYMAKLDPEFNWGVDDFVVDGNVLPYMVTPAGCFVRAWVTFGGKTVRHTYPVWDFNKKAVSPASATANDINNAQMRGFVKCVALFGLGLYIYSGEDLPAGPDISNTPASEIIIDFGKYRDMGLTLPEVAQQGWLGLAYLKQGATHSRYSPELQAKFAEVYKAHAPELADDQIDDAICDAETAKELAAIYGLLSDQQKEDFKSTFTAAKEGLV
jgi:hypothetical protein